MNRRHLGAGIVVAPLLVLSSLATDTQASFSAAAVTNTSNTVLARTFFTCRNAESNTPPAFGAWALGTAAIALSSETDISGNGRFGTWTVAASAAANNFGCTRDSPAASVTFDGLTSCLVAAQGSPAFAFPVNNFSLEAWVRVPATGGGPILIYQPTNTAVDNLGTGSDRLLYVDTAGKFQFGNYQGGAWVVTSPLAYRDNAWHHVAAVNSSTAGIRLYVDGVQVATRAALSDAVFSGWWHVGCGKLAGWPAAPAASNPAFFSGQIQYAAVYTTDLTAAQVRDHYLAGAP